MDDEKLIELIRNHEELYNIGHTNYSNTKIKQKMWMMIGAKLNQPAAKCKARWANIRDNFRRSLRKRATKYGHASKRIQKYKYEEYLHFLVEYIKESAVKDDPENDEQYDFVNIEENDVGHNNENSNLNNDIHHDTTMDNPSLSSTLLKYVIEKNETGCRQEIHPVDAWLQGWSSTLKNFDSYYLNIAKSKISNIILELEMQQIIKVQQQNLTSHSPTP